MLTPSLEDRRGDNLALFNLVVFLRASSSQITFALFSDTLSKLLASDLFSSRILILTSLCHALGVGGLGSRCKEIR